MKRHNSINDTANSIIEWRITGAISDQLYTRWYNRARQFSPYKPWKFAVSPLESVIYYSECIVPSIKKSISIPRQAFLSAIPLTARGRNGARWHASANETKSEGEGEGEKGGRRKEGKPRQVFSLSASLLRRRYISSRRKKFNVAVKADGNADCGLWASPVTVLHRTMQHLSKWPVVLSPPFVRFGRPLLAASRSPRISRTD